MALGFLEPEPRLVVKGDHEGTGNPAMIFKVLLNFKYPVLCPRKHSHTAAMRVPHLDLETQ